MKKYSIIITIITLLLSINCFSQERVNEPLLKLNWRSKVVTNIIGCVYNEVTGQWSERKNSICEPQQTDPYYGRIKSVQAATFVKDNIRYFCLIVKHTEFGYDNYYGVRLYSGNWFEATDIFVMSKDTFKGIINPGEESLNYNLREATFYSNDENMSIRSLFSDYGYDMMRIAIKSYDNVIRFKIINGYRNDWTGKYGRFIDPVDNHYFEVSRGEWEKLMCNF